MMAINWSFIDSSFSKVVKGKILPSEVMTDNFMHAKDPSPIRVLDKFAVEWEKSEKGHSTLKANL